MMRICYIAGTTLLILFTNTTLNRLGFGMLTVRVGTAIFHWPKFDYICTLLQVICWRSCLKFVLSWLPYFAYSCSKASLRVSMRKNKM